MENNSFKKICGTMNYHTYSNLEHFFEISGISAYLANHFLLSQYPTLSTATHTLAGFSIAIYIAMTCSSGINYTKDITQIRELYQEFIAKYNKLNQIFDFNDPIQIYAMFRYLLWKDYLSVDKKFEFSESKSFIDMKGLYGANIISGDAVCRHISAMLVDILNQYGVEAWKLGVYSKVQTIRIGLLDQPKYTKEELIELARTYSPDDEYTFKKITSFIEEFVENRKQNIELSSNMRDEKNPLKKVVGNHAITFAVKNGKSYFLDPTKIRTYRLYKNEKRVLYDDEYGKIPIKAAVSMVAADASSYLNARRNLLLQYPSIPLEEEQFLTSETLKICEGNIDLFDQFYNENKELYSELSNKVLSIRKPKSTSKSL